MTLQEKIEAMELKTKKIEEGRIKKYLYISPKVIQGGVTLVGDDKTYNLYENMDDNTIKFVEKVVNNMISFANYNDGNIINRFDFHLVFCGTWDDLGENIGNNVDVINDNKEKIVAIFRFTKMGRPSDYYNDFLQYDYVYLNYIKLLELFEKNNITLEINPNDNNYNYDMDNNVTYFIATYCPNKEIKKDNEENGKQLTLKK